MILIENEYLLSHSKNETSIQTTTEAKKKEGTVSVLGASFLLWTDVAGVGALAAGYNIF